MPGPGPQWRQLLWGKKMPFFVRRVQITVKAGRTHPGTLRATRSISIFHSCSLQMSFCHSDAQDILPLGPGCAPLNMKDSAEALSPVRNKGWLAYISSFFFFFLRKFSNLPSSPRPAFRPVTVQGAGSINIWQLLCKW